MIINQRVNIDEKFYSVKYNKMVYNILNGTQNEV